MSGGYTDVSDRLHDMQEVVKKAQKVYRKQIEDHLKRMFDFDKVCDEEFDKHVKEWQKAMRKRKTLFEKVRHYRNLGVKLTPYAENMVKYSSDTSDSD